MESDAIGPLTANLGWCVWLSNARGTWATPSVWSTAPIRSWSRCPTGELPWPARAELLEQGEPRAQLEQRERVGVVARRAQLELRVRLARRVQPARAARRALPEPRAHPVAAVAARR